MRGLVSAGLIYAVLGFGVWSIMHFVSRNYLQGAVTAVCAGVALVLLLNAGRNNTEGDAA